MIVSDKKPYQKQRLIIFVKRPVAGKVKTRLAQDCSAEQACLYYQAMVACCLQHLSDYSEQRQQPLNLYIGYTLSDDPKLIEKWLKPHLPTSSMVTVSYFKQVESDSLGDRIQQAFSDSFDQGYEHVSIIGTDCVDITPSILHQLLNPLTFAIGPTHDGGYYGLALQASFFSDNPHTLAHLFTPIRWSSANTYLDTLNAAKSIKIKLQKLPTLHDIDYLEDWQRALDSQQGSMLKEKVAFFNKHN